MIITTETKSTPPCGNHSCTISISAISAYNMDKEYHHSQTTTSVKTTCTQIITKSSNVYLLILYNIVGEVGYTCLWVYRCKCLSGADQFQVGLGAILCTDGTCTTDLCIRIASAMAAMTKLNRDWRSNTISFASKLKLYKFFVTSVLVAVRRRLCLLTVRKGSRLSRPIVWGNSSASPAWSTKPTTGLRSKINFLVDPQKTFSGNCHETKTRMVRTCHVPRQPLKKQKTSFGAPWRVGDTVVGGGNAGWTTSKSGRSCLCKNCSQWSPPKKKKKKKKEEKTGRGSLLNRPSHVPPMTPAIKGLNWTSLCQF